MYVYLKCFLPQFLFASLSIYILGGSTLFTPPVANNDVLGFMHK